MSEDELVRPSTRRVDPKALRALAHPLRLALLGALREYGPATATGLGARLGESSGLTSYHLRQLAAHEFVVEDLGRGNRRERWWRAVHENTFIDPALFAHPDPEVAGTMSSLMHEVAAVHTRRLDTWLATASSWSREWQSSADISDYRLSLTPARARALSAELDEVIARHCALAAPDQPPETDAEAETKPDDESGADDGGSGDHWAPVMLQLRMFPPTADMTPDLEITSGGDGDEAAGPRAAVGLLAGYRVRHGIGEQIGAWVADELAARGLATVSPCAPTDLAHQPRWNAAVAVSPACTAVPARQQERLAGLCSGLTIAAIRYGRPADLHSATPLTAALAAGEAVLGEMGMFVEAPAWRGRGGPCAFDRVALQLLLDQLHDSSASRRAPHR